MKLTRPRARQPSETLVALVDVVFFLLVFALLIGRMDATAPFDVSPPKAASGADMPGGGLTVSVSASGDLALDGEGMAPNALVKAAKEVVDTDPETRLRINADGATPLRHVLPLVEQLKAVGARDIVLVVTPDASR